MLSEYLIWCFENVRIVRYLLCLARRSSSDIYKSHIIRRNKFRINNSKSIFIIHYALLMCKIYKTWYELYWNFNETILQRISRRCQISSFDNVWNSWSSNRDRFTVTALSLTSFEIQTAYKAVTEFNKFYDLSDNPQSFSTISSLL